MSPLLVLLGATLCALTMSSEVVPQADFNLQGIAGKWYLIGFATNAQWFVKRKATMKMGTAMLNPTAEGDLDISYASLSSDGSCWRKNSLAKKTDTPGRFTYTCQRWGSENDMRVVDVNYEQYALIYTTKKKAGELTTVTKLYGREEEVGAEVMEKFRQMSLEAGALPENIVFLPKQPECPAA
ncbi:PREDICTED: lipocalin-like [Cyprinodon variegatus]|nr:PREDICTED: lipocalin-like [Cyprinodon variegatus]